MDLRVRAVSARNLTDTQVFGTQDPYCKIVLHEKRYKTRVHDNGGLAPLWNEEFSFHVVDPQIDQLHIKVKNTGFTSSTLIGEVCLPVSMFLRSGFTDQWYALHNDGKNAGEINLQEHVIGGPVPVVQGQM